MKILQIIPSLGSGGAERLVVDLCNEMADQGQDVTLCIVQNPEEEDYGFYLHELHESVRFISLNQKKGFTFRNISSLQKMIREISPDIVHVHLSAILYLYVLSLVNLNTCFYHTLHNLAEKTCDNSVLKLMNYFYFSLGIIKVITISEECDISYQKFYKLRNATMINNGRKANLPSINYPSVREEINHLKKQDSDLVFIHVARYHRQKNQELLIRVFNRLEKEGISYLLLVLGDWSFCEEAKELAQTANKNIHFLGTKKNVSDYLFLSDAFCMTSLYEGMPISLLEALSCGCTPVCTPVGGIKDIVQDGITGFLSENLSEDAYYTCIKRYMIQKDNINRKVLIKLFEDKYSIEYCAGHHISLYSSKKQISHKINFKYPQL